MVIAQAWTNSDFYQTLHYVGGRSREPQAKVVHSSMSEINPSRDLTADALVKTAEQMAKQAERVRNPAFRKPCYHICLSVGQEDQLCYFQWNQMARSFLDKAGLEVENFDSVGFLHEDTQYPDDGEVRPHLHLVVNRAGVDGQVASTSWDYYRFQSALREVETEMGLSPEPNSWEIKQRRDTPGQVHRQQRDPEALSSVRVQLQQDIDREMEGAKSFGAVVQCLEKSGADVRATDQGWSLAKDGVALAGYQLGRQYTRPAIEKRLEAEAEEAISEASTENGLMEVKDLAITTQGREVVQNLQRLAPKQFSRPNGGSLQWKAKLAEGGSETYDFAISTQPNNAQVISGDDSGGRSVFQATIEPDGEIRTTLLEIPAEQTELLASKARQNKQSKQRRARRTRQPEQAELEL